MMKGEIRKNIIMVALHQEKNFLSDFHKNGFTIVRNLIPKDICLAIKAAGLLRASLQKNYKPAINIHHEHIAYMQAMSHPALLEHIEMIFGGFVRGLQTEMFYHVPKTPGFAWHQDNFYVRANPPEHFVSAWLSLEHQIDEKNGAILAAPGTHKLGLCDVQEVPGYAVSDNQDKNANKLESLFDHNKYPHNVAKMGMGDVLFIHSLVQHASTQNISHDRYRMAFLMTFIKNGTPFRSGANAKRKDFNVYY